MLLIGVYGIIPSYVYKRHKGCVHRPVCEYSIRLGLADTDMVAIDLCEDDAVYQAIH